MARGGGWSDFLDTSQNITDLISYLFGLIHTGSVRFIHYPPYFGFAWANGRSNSNSVFIFEASLYREVFFVMEVKQLYIREIKIVFYGTVKVDG